MVEYLGFTMMYLCKDFSVFFLLAVCWYTESVDCLPLLLKKFQPLSLQILSLILPLLLNLQLNMLYLPTLSYMSLVLYGNFHVFIFSCYILDSFFSFFPSVLQFLSCVQSVVRPTYLLFLISFIVLFYLLSSV